MFERAQSGPWKSVSGKEGAHYNNYGCRDEHGMSALREFFPTGEANELNFVLFSTSGVHGTYSTIEEEEAAMLRGNKYDDGDDCTPSVTFLIVHPRICCIRHGNCEPKTPDDIAFLKRLRESSWRIVQSIGREEKA
jgi:hypothetical protein